MPLYELLSQFVHNTFINIMTRSILTHHTTIATAMIEASLRSPQLASSAAGVSFFEEMSDLPAVVQIEAKI